eukprot:5122019-Pyramimonas_sp.AAC.2
MRRPLVRAVMGAIHHRWTQPKDRQHWDMESDAMNFHVPFGPVQLHTMDQTTARSRTPGGNEHARQTTDGGRPAMREPRRSIA